MNSGNKGEWGEIYVFLKLLVDGRLYASDSRLSANPEQYFPIVAIKHYIEGIEITYLREEDSVLTLSNGEVIAKTEIAQLIKLLDKLRIGIENKAGRAFEIPEFLKNMKANNILWEKESKNSKSDICILVHDKRTSSEIELGFSVKSLLGSPPTLLNPSESTRFTYKIYNNFDDGKKKIVNSVNEREITERRINKISELGGELAFEKPDNEIFDLNLKLIDGDLPKIISELLLLRFALHGKEKRCYTKISDLLPILIEKNPLNYNLEFEHPFYEYKIKNFLIDVALGMTPTKKWDGIQTATGGIIYLKKDWSIVCFQIFNKNEFQDFLLSRTKLDIPAERSKYRYVFKRDESYFFNLNLQIRFVSL